VAGALGQEKGKDAATLQIAKEYIQMCVPVCLCVCVYAAVPAHILSACPIRASTF
jgi:hypothetical protein